MKKSLFTLAFCLLTASASYAQFSLGFKAALAIGSNRVDSKTNGTSFDSDGATARIIIGGIADIQFAEKYAFSTGILYTTKQAKFTETGSVKYANGGNIGNGSESWGLQYIQIPLTVKLFTSEVFPNAKVYIQAGPQLEILVGKKNKASSFKRAANGNNPTVDEPTMMNSFNPIDVSVTASAGIEYTIGENILFGGLNFQTGFINTINTTNYATPNGTKVDFTSKNTLFSLEIGIKL